MTTNTGRLITLEGIEGVGKTSNLEFIGSLLTKSGRDYIVTREPGGTKLGENLRELLLKTAHQGISADTELLMMFAARAEHIDKIINPAIHSGKDVLCDRFTEATYAYQGGGRQLNTHIISELEVLVQGSLRPDLTIILDTPVAVGRARAGSRSEPDRIEQEDDKFFERVRNTYLDLARQHPQRICVIDASVELSKVQEQIVEKLHEFKILN